MPAVGSVRGVDTMSMERVPMVGPEAAPIQEGIYGKRLASKHPEWGAGAIGGGSYQVAMAILRDIGNDTEWRTLNSRGPKRVNVDL